MWGGGVGARSNAATMYENNMRIPMIYFNSEKRRLSEKSSTSSSNFRAVYTKMEQLFSILAGVSQ